MLGYKPELLVVNYIMEWAKATFLSIFKNKIQFNSEIIPILLLS